MPSEQVGAVVLFLDDDPDIINAARIKFEEIHGHDFRPASSMEEAIEIVKAVEGEVVAFVDFHFGAREKSHPLGLKFMRWCQQHVSHRVALYGFTADHSSGVLLTALKSGAITVFYKDSDPNIMKVMDVLVAHASVPVVRQALRRGWDDFLTGFWNIGGFRREVLPQLQVARPRSDSEGGVDRRDRKRFGQFALLFMEIELGEELEKEIEESENFGLSDKLALTFSNIIRSQVRPTDHLCRAGERVFLAFLPDTDEAHALEIAEAIRQEAGEVKVGEKGFTPRFRVGVNHVDRDELGANPTLDLEHMITKARKARQ